MSLTYCIIRFLKIKKKIEAPVGQQNLYGISDEIAVYLNATVT